MGSQSVHRFLDKAFRRIKMKIGILSQDIRLYSTKRLYETALERGHDTESSVI